MFTSRHGFVFGFSAAEFSSSYPLPDSIARLMEVAPRSAFFLRREAAVGIVTQGGVCLKRGGLTAWRPYELRFIGSFTQNESGVLLSGQFTVNGRAQILGVIQRGFFFSLLAYLLLSAAPTAGWAPLVFVGIVSSDLLGQKNSQRSVSRDVIWLSSIIEQALGSR